MVGEHPQAGMSAGLNKRRDGVRHLVVQQVHLRLQLQAVGCAAWLLLKMGCCCSFSLSAVQQNLLWVFKPWLFDVNASVLILSRGVPYLVYICS
jgi:hypothetical protein